MPPKLRRGSERGGFRGSIAPPPHDPKNVVHEQTMLVYATDPADPTSSAETVLADTMKEVQE